MRYSCKKQRKFINEGENAMHKQVGKYARKGVSILLILILICPLFAAQSFAVPSDYTIEKSKLPSLELGKAPAGTPGATFINQGEDGENQISMTDARSFEIMIPVDMNEEAAALVEVGALKWTLSRSEPYLSTELYPNYKSGGDLDKWKDSSNNALFRIVETSVYSVDEDTACLKMILECNSYYADGSVPHGGGSQPMMDLIGWYSLAAVQGDERDEPLGSVPVKVVPYDHFRTMGEVYEEIEKLGDYDSNNNKGYFVEKYSMGESTAGYDMPYLIVAKDAEAVDNWLALAERAETEPDKVLEELETGTLGDFQVPVIFSNIHSNETSATDSILDFAHMLLENETIDYDVMDQFTTEGGIRLKEEMGPEGITGSVAVPDLVEKTATYLGYLTADNYDYYENEDGEMVKYTYSGPVDLEKYYEMQTNTVAVSELLDEVFFILVPEENVEGRIYMSRVSSGGLDLNRDNSFQTQNETQNMQKLIGMYNPVSLTELHGRVTSFQCEPCDPPHEPNFEYDLLARHLMPGGEAFGIAATSNNEGYNSYVIPQRDYLEYTGEKGADSSNETYWEDPWDDMSTSYTPQFAMLHGCVGYTVELPAYNDETAKAATYGQLGQSHYIAENKEAYFITQLEIFARGVTNANSNAFELVGQWFCDQNDIEGAEADLFRPEYDGEGQNGNFYPECYIIPLDRSNQTNLQAAHDMMQWLSRNDVKVMLTEKSFNYKGKSYPAGTMIVPMDQAKRSVANSALYDGTLILDWTVLYSEGITTFNETRGFDMETCAEPAAYKSIKAACGEPMDYASCLIHLADVTSSLDNGRTGYQVIISNASEDSTAAVNWMLQEGKKVGMITEGTYKGDFICSYKDWDTVSGKFILTGTCISRDYPAAQIITKSPVIYINGRPADTTSGYIRFNYLDSRAYSYNYDRQAMDLMNFETTTDLSKADIIIGASALDKDALSKVQSGMPYIGYGSSATGTARLNNFFNDIERNSVKGSMDALAYVTYPAENLINASYILDGDDVMYGYGAGYFSSVPEGAEILVKIDEDREPTEGFLRSSESNLTDFLNGSIQGFSYEGKDKSSKEIDVAFFANTLTNKVHQRDEYAFISNFAFSNMLGEKYTASAYSGGGSGGSGNKTPATAPTPTEFSAEEAIKLAVKTFSDVRATDWYAESIGRILHAKLMNGTTSDTYGPGALFDRGMMATVLYRMAGSPTVAGNAPFDDVAAGDWYSHAVAWGASAGIVNGYNGYYAPKDPVTREQVVTILYRYAKTTGAEANANGSLAGFTDSAQISEFAAEAMKWAVGNGIISGTADTRLNPKATATRAEVAAMLVRSLELFE